VASAAAAVAAGPKLDEDEAVSVLVGAVSAAADVAAVSVVDAAELVAVSVEDEDELASDDTEEVAAESDAVDEPVASGEREERVEKPLTDTALLVDEAAELSVDVVAELSADVVAELSVDVVAELSVVVVSVVVAAVSVLVDEAESVEVEEDEVVVSELLLPPLFPELFVVSTVTVHCLTSCTAG
jgi:hypothetical protein